MLIIPGNRTVCIVTTEGIAVVYKNVEYEQVKNCFSTGRFECKSTRYHGESCNQTADATIEDYVSSGYWPGNLKNISCLYSVEMLRHWYLIKHNLPNSSEKKFLEGLERLNEGTRRMSCFLFFPIFCF